MLIFSLRKYTFSAYCEPKIFYSYFRNHWLLLFRHISEVDPIPQRIAACAQGFNKMADGVQLFLSTNLYLVGQSVFLGGQIFDGDSHVYTQQMLQLNLITIGH
jgi:hypothetical protein